MREDRKDGFYWVKFAHSRRWSPAELRSGYWQVLGEDIWGAAAHARVTTIGPRLEPPERHAVALSDRPKDDHDGEPATSTARPASG